MLENLYLFNLFIEIYEFYCLDIFTVKLPTARYPRLLINMSTSSVLDSGKRDLVSHLPRSRAGGWVGLKHAWSRTRADGDALGRPLRTAGTGHSPARPQLGSPKAKMLKV